jgi:osmoprotectant transport system substrate-binding protein
MQLTRRYTARFAAVALAMAGAGGYVATTAGSAVAHNRSASVRAHALPGAGKPTFVLGDKNFAEEFILGDLYQQALKAQGYTVTVKSNIGSSELIWKALKGGQIQGYPEYDGTLLSSVAGITKNPPNSAAAVTQTRNWLKKKGDTFSNATPFTDADAIVVTKKYAQTNHLSSIGNLAKLGKAVKLDGDSPFATRSPDGLPGLKKYYGVVPTFSPVSIGDFYSLLDNGQANAIAGFTTDPQLQSGKYVALKDPKFIFGFQNVGLVVKQSVVNAEGPDFLKTINKVNSLLTQTVIIKLDAAAELDKVSPAVIAKKFLKANHLS